MNQRDLLSACGLWGGRVVVAGKLTLCLLAMLVGLTGCFGRFALTRTVYDWNSDIENPYLKSATMAVLFVVPAYPVAALADTFIFNVIEFWSGETLLMEPTVKSVGGNLAETTDVESGLSGDVAIISRDYLNHLEAAMAGVQSSDGGAQLAGRGPEVGDTGGAGDVEHVNTVNGMKMEITADGTLLAWPTGAEQPVVIGRPTPMEIGVAIHGQNDQATTIDRSIADGTLIMQFDGEELARLFQVLEKERLLQQYANSKEDAVPASGTAGDSAGGAEAGAVVVPGAEAEAEGQRQQ